jgi:hypothetical protein
MAEAKRPGGLYFMGDDAVDAEGRKIEDAPKKPADTAREKQPGAIGVAYPEERLAKAMVTELVGAGVIKGSGKESARTETKVQPAPEPPAGATVVKPSAADRAPGTPTAGAPEALAAANDQGQGGKTSSGTKEGSERSSARKGGARKSARKSAGK